MQQPIARYTSSPFNAVRGCRRDGPARGRGCRLHAIVLIAGRASGSGLRRICRESGRRLHATAVCSAAVEGPRIAKIGDMVTLSFVAVSPDGTVLEQSTEPMQLELGSSKAISNPIFQGFDAALQGATVGQEVEIEASGPTWTPELLFTVPRGHPEIARLEGRYKTQGGLAVGGVVQLANGKMAAVVELNDDIVKLDANEMLASRTVTFKLQLLSILDQ